MSSPKRFTESEQATIRKAAKILGVPPHILPAALTSLPQAQTSFAQSSFDDHLQANSLILDGDETRGLVAIADQSSPALQYHNLSSLSSRTFPIKGSDFGLGTATSYAHSRTNEVTTAPMGAELLNEHELPRHVSIGKEFGPANTRSWQFPFADSRNDTEPLINHIFIGTADPSYVPTNNFFSNEYEIIPNSNTDIDFRSWEIQSWQPPIISIPTESSATPSYLHPNGTGLNSGPQLPLEDISSHLILPPSDTRTPSSTTTLSHETISAIDSDATIGTSNTQSPTTINHQVMSNTEILGTSAFHQTAPPVLREQQIQPLGNSYLELLDLMSDQPGFEALFPYPAQDFQCDSAFSNNPTWSQSSRNFDMGSGIRIGAPVGSHDQSGWLNRASLAQFNTSGNLGWLDEILNLPGVVEEKSMNDPASSVHQHRDLSQQDPALSRPGPQRVSRPKKARKSYLENDLRQTNLTRNIRGCIRCRMNRKRCVPDLNNLNGPCITCQKTTFNVFNLPCLRYKITDSILYRTGPNSAFEEHHPLSGPKYGDFYLPKAWTDDLVKILEITHQNRGIKLRLKVRQFHPPPDQEGTDLKGIGGKGRNIYAIPWALTDPDSAFETIEIYINESMESYISSIVDSRNTIVWQVFNIALALATLPEPLRLIRNSLRLWTATRFIEGGWRCCGDEKLGAEKLGNPLRPASWVSLPPYIDHQFASVIFHRVLAPLRQKVLKGLEDLVIANKPSNWFRIFLTTFILLHNYELSTAFEVRYSIKRKFAVRYSSMPLIRASQSGAKTILAHFHYVCKGNIPFRQDFDWKSESNKKMAQLSSDQLDFVEHYIQELEAKASEFQVVGKSDYYDDDYWFISQMFEHGWTPRDTHEYSPPLLL